MCAYVGKIRSSPVHVRARAFYLAVIGQFWPCWNLKMRIADCGRAVITICVHNGCSHSSISRLFVAAAAHASKLQKQTRACLSARCFRRALPILHPCHSENNPVKTDEMRISQHAILICTPRYQRMLIKIIFCICLVFHAHMQIASVAFQHSVIRFMKDSCNT